MMRIAFLGVWMFTAFGFFLDSLLRRYGDVTLSNAAIVSGLLSSTILTICYYQRSNEPIRWLRDSAYVGYALLSMFFLSLVFATDGFARWDWEVIRRHTVVALGATGVGWWIYAFGAKFRGQVGSTGGERSPSADDSLGPAEEHGPRKSR